MSVQVYALALLDDKTGSQSLAKERHQSGMPVSFQLGYAEYMFQFSETHIICNEGDLIVLLQGSIDISDIAKGNDYVATFKHRLQTKQNLTDWQEIDRKRVANVNSHDYRERLLQDLNNTQQRLLQQRESAVA